MNRALMPIRIPAGWAVVFNNFVELPLEGEAEADDADKYLSDDVLSIEQLRLADGRWETDPDGVLIDLSWSESGDPAGEYVLSVVRGSWDGATAIFRHRSGNRIRNAIELTMTRVMDGWDLDRIFGSSDTDSTQDTDE